jgi:hypothetical protein
MRGIEIVIEKNEAITLNHLVCFVPFTIFKDKKTGGLESKKINIKLRKTICRNEA